VIEGRILIKRGDPQLKAFGVIASLKEFYGTACVFRERLVFLYGLRASDKIGICVHLIFGLPDEDDDMMLESVREVAKLRPEFVKLHLLHVLRSSRLAKVYERGEYTPLERERYISLVVRALELLPPDTVIARLTGDGMGEDLLAPEWSRKKVSVINDIDKMLYATDSYQGKYFNM